LPATIIIARCDPKPFAREHFECAACRRLRAPFHELRFATETTVSVDAFILPGKAT
jgi:hypothetical protein